MNVFVGDSDEKIVAMPHGLYEHEHAIQHKRRDARERQLLLDRAASEGTSALRSDGTQVTQVGNGSGAFPRLSSTRAATWFRKPSCRDT